MSFKIVWQADGGTDYLLCEVDKQTFIQMLKAVKFRVPNGIPTYFYHGELDGTYGIYVFPEPD